MFKTLLMGTALCVGGISACALFVSLLGNLLLHCVAGYYGSTVTFAVLPLSVAWISGGLLAASLFIASRKVA
jgi:hypothetical protein